MAIFGERDRRLFELRYGEGWTLARIGTELGMSPGSVWRLEHDRLKRLRMTSGALVLKRRPVSDYERELFAWARELWSRSPQFHWMLFGEDCNTGCFCQRLITVLDNQPTNQ